MDDRLAAPHPRLIQAVDRALTLLMIIAARGPISRAGVARAANVNESTAWRLLATLEHHQLIDREPETGQYTVGIAVTELAANSPYSGLIYRARPVLERLSNAAEETTVLTVPRGLDVIPIDQVTVSHVVSVRWIGRWTPAHSSSSGKLLLASLSPAELEAFLVEPLDRFTEKTITDPTELRRVLDQVRRAGVAISIGEYEIGLNSVSSAARNAMGRPIAFVTITGPNYRLPGDRLRQLAPMVASAANELTTLMRAPRTSDASRSRLERTGDRSGA